MSKELLSEAVQQQSNHQRPARRHSQSDIMISDQDLAHRKKEQVRSGLFITIIECKYKTLLSSLGPGQYEKVRVWF